MGVFLMGLVTDAAKEVRIQPGNGNGNGRFSMLWVGFPQWLLIVLIAGGIGINSLGMWRLYEWVDRHEGEEGYRTAASQSFVKQVEKTNDAITARIEDLELNATMIRLMLRQKYPETADAIEDMMQESQKRREMRR
jgi:hypothetical protein